MNELLNKITQSDAIETLRKLPDNSVDLIVIDPPYNIGKDKRWDKWDKVDEYVAFMTEIFKECERVLKDTGCFYWFHNDMEQIAKLMSSIGESTDFIYKQMITIDKPDNSFVKDLYGSQNKFRNYLNIAEYCLFYVKPDTSGWSETGLEKVLVKDNFLSVTEKIRAYVENKFSREYIHELFLKEGRYSSELSARVHASYKMGWNKGKRFDLMDEKLFNYLDEYLKFPFTYEAIKYEYDSLRLSYESEREQYEVERENLKEKRYRFNASEGVKNVWSYSFREDKKTKHPTQKPVRLIEDIIKYSSNEGDTVLDCFLGSGTTAVAAINTNRQFIGIEREQEYVEIGNRRIAEALKRKEE